MDDDFDLRDFDNLVRLFPLPGVVLFPHAVLPLHIFEPRYKQMTEDALAGDRLVTIVQIREPIDWDATVEPALEEVACLGRILKHERLPEGKFNFLLLGLKRVRLVREVPTETLYRRAEVEVLEDEPAEGPQDEHRSELAGLFRALAERQGALDPDMGRLLESEVPLGVLTDIVAHALALPPAVKQALLADRRVERRADGLIAVLRELAAKRGGATPPRRYPPPISLN
jgi:uncharacterized protein